MIHCLSMSLSMLLSSIGGRVSWVLDVASSLQLMWHRTEHKLHEAQKISACTSIQDFCNSHWTQHKDIYWKEKNQQRWPQTWNSELSDWWSQNVSNLADSRVFAEKKVCHKKGTIYFWSWQIRQDPYLSESYPPQAQVILTRKSWCSFFNT